MKAVESRRGEEGVGCQAQTRGVGLEPPGSAAGGGGGVAECAGYEDRGYALKKGAK